MRGRPLGGLIVWILNVPSFSIALFCSEDKLCSTGNRSLRLVGDHDHALVTES
jgi:hypothetical protein